MDNTYTVPTYLLGLDLGKRRDYTALAVLRQTGDIESQYTLVHLDRWRGRNYRDCVPKIQQIEHRLYQVTNDEYLQHTGVGYPIGIDIALMVDQTGVGEAVVNDVIRAAGITCHGVTITSGTAVNRDGADFRVPKRELVGRMEVVLENRRLDYPTAEQLPIVDTLISEMDNFRAQTKLATGHDSFGAGDEWRDGNHDDLVLAVAMAVWFGEYQNEGRQTLMQTSDAISGLFQVQAGGYGSW